MTTKALPDLFRSAFFVRDHRRFGFLLMVSLVVSAALSAFGSYLSGILPGLHFLLQSLSFLLSFSLVSVLFAAIYKFLPDTPITWHDVAIGAIVTALMFTIGKTFIALYIGSYGSAGALVVILLWIYYSVQIFLLGAEFIRAYAESHGSLRGKYAVHQFDRQG